MIGDLTIAEQWLEEADVFTRESIYANFARTGYERDNKFNDPTYNPRTYIGYTQFEDVRAAATRNSEGSMQGELVVDLQSIESPELKAHYILQTGENTGGTLDFVCESWAR